MWTPKCAGCVVEHAKAVAAGVPVLPPVNDATVILDGRSLAECHIQVLTPQEEAALRRQMMQQPVAAAPGTIPVTDAVAAKLMGRLGNGRG